MLVAGAPDVSSAETSAIYAPWSWIVWWTAMVLGAESWNRSGHVRSRGALPNGGRDGGLLRGDRDGAARMVREQLRPSRLRALGERRAISEAARLIDARSSVRELLRGIGVRLRTLKPAARSRRNLSRRLAGLGRASYIRDCGPAHVLVFAPTRSGKGVGHRDSNAPQLAALGPDSRPQR